ncbi:WXG100-like domain-containing protein [Microbacterium sp. JZ31]|uniref:WXG100-like domain-containing protein n=1 Tax=Microbacterium sp. JZ31 TaxID=1906274 RepID=UPI003FA58AEF
MMLPNELVWVMEKLGFEWPDIDEDEVRKGAVLLRAYGSDLEAAIQAVDRKVNGDLASALVGQTGPAYVSAWNANRSQNLQKLVDLMPPAATAMDVGADAIFALKIKVIADVTTTMIALVAMLTNPLTAVGAGAMLIVKKKMLNAAVDVAVEQLLNQLLPMAVEPLGSSCLRWWMRCWMRRWWRRRRGIRISSRRIWRRWSRGRRTCGCMGRTFRR